MPNDPSDPSSYAAQLGGSGWPGQLAPATDELYRRPVRLQPDPVTASHQVGPPTEYGTARSLSNGTDRGEIVVPQIVNGFLLTPHDAWDYAMRTGRNFGTFSTPELADPAAQRIHELQQDYFTMLRLGRPDTSLSPLAITGRRLLARPPVRSRSLSRR
jgi:hypothetical protein